jgi:hypothetical protein
MPVAQGIASKARPLGKEVGTPLGTIVGSIIGVALPTGGWREICRSP